MNVCFETFGCRLNRAETLNMEALFLANGWKKTKHHSDADLIIVRGCSVTARAQRDTEKYIEHLKAKYPSKRIFTTGCLINKTPEAMIDAAMRSATKPENFITEAIPSTTARAYLKVQDGCNGNCSYCIVPKFRGKSVSEDFNSVVTKAKKFINCGYTEIVITGCNLSLYLSNGKRLADLLAELATLESNGHRIRLGSLEPFAGANDVVDVMAEHKNICRFLHIPIQSASNRILAEMHRPYKIPELDKLINYASEKIPNLALGCDVITGFPTESEYDFNATFEFVKRHSFTNIHAFPYSERPGTMATKILPAIPRQIRSDRAHRLSALVAEKRHNFAKKFKRHEVEVVIEDAATLSGWTSEYLWCTSRTAKNNLFTKQKNLTRKSLVKMRVKDLSGDTLYADPL